MGQSSKGPALSERDFDREMFRVRKLVEAEAELSPHLKDLFVCSLSNQVRACVVWFCGGGEGRSEGGNGGGGGLPPWMRCVVYILYARTQSPPRKQTLTYKGQLTPEQLYGYYGDLQVREEKTHTCIHT